MKILLGNVILFSMSLLIPILLPLTLHAKAPDKTELPGQASREKPRLLVLKTKVTGVGNTKTVDPVALTNLVGSVISNTGKYRLVSSEDMVAMLDQEQQKQLAGCDDVSCMAEIGAAMGARFLIYSNVGKVGGAYLATVSLIDTKDGSVSNRQSITVQNEKRILAGMEVAAKRLVGLKAELPPLEQAGKPANLAPWKWSALAGGLLMAALGGAGTGLAVSNRNKADDADKQSDMDDYRAKGETWNKVAITGYAVGGALLATSVVLFVLDSMKGTKGKREPGKVDEKKAMLLVSPMPGLGFSLNLVMDF
ncbi:MAG: hypothetical protein GXP49_06930 [Deltaproteobacteria bacterium]|nr:hypothetical protein [Deltaproteobacteria bacterium]